VTAADALRIAVAVEALFVLGLTAALLWRWALGGALTAGRAMLSLGTAVLAATGAAAGLARIGEPLALYTPVRAVGMTLCALGLLWLAKEAA